MTRAIVVGSGPNGLAAAITLAGQGCDVTVLEGAETVGGGTRSAVSPAGVMHDLCSGFHPLALDTDFSHFAGLSTFGLRWAWPEIQFAHPLDDGRGAAVVRSVENTAGGLGADGSTYRAIWGALVDRLDGIAAEILQPMLHVPRHPVGLGMLGLLGALPATALGQLWRTEEARSLWAGVAAHGFRPLGAPMTSAIGLTLGAAAHKYGWPVAVGGSQSIATAMVRKLECLGGKVETGVWVSSYRDLPPAEVVMLDTAPAAAVRILGAAMPGHVARAYRRFRHGPGAFQVSLAVDGGIPWRYEPARRAGTVHLGGTMREIDAAESALSKGQMPRRPVVLVGQQYLADPSRSVGTLHPVDAYAHVPAGWPHDATEAVLSEIARAAPGFRDRIVEVSTRSTVQLAQDNPNHVGGDIISGANTPLQLLFRPRVALNPYATGVPGVYLCSAATPPGAGAHGMCGYRAATAALRDLGR